jgi:hypothetical protein
VQHQRRLLLRALDRNEAHSGARHRFAAGIGVGRVVLAALDIGLGVSRRYEQHFVINRNHSYTVFRVRVDGLKPGITYYYTVDSMGGDGTRDGVESTVYQFTTPADLREP